MEKVKLQIDGYCVEAQKGQNVLQAALDAGIYIPHLCYHPDLTSQGGCKLCAVEIEGEAVAVLSCETIVKEGMHVKTHTAQVEQLRQIALELVLASHPHDCTSCDKYLNCELQALMQYMGIMHARMRTIEKENTQIATSDSLIKREMQRCIQCGRCVRACDELRGVKALTFNQKDGETYIGTVGDVPLTETDCRFCGACVEVCPTGAIQDAVGIFSKTSPKHLAMIPCKDTCPAHTDIPTYVRLVEQGRYSEAVAVIREKLTFPHALSYVCNHECESRCKRGIVNEAIAIRELKRVAVEGDQEASWKQYRKISRKNGKKIGVVGGGPAGMSAAYYLAKKGYEVTVYEKQPKLGGMLSYGIPKYRLPQAIVDKEIALLLEVGIKTQLGEEIQALEVLQDKNYDAVLIAVGTTQGKRPNGYQRYWKNGLDAVTFCRNSIEGTLPALGKCVAVYGGGNVAFDCARTAKRLGVEEVHIICMESREEMLADQEEIRCGQEEGIHIHNQSYLIEMEETLEHISALKLGELHSFRFAEKGLEMEIVEGVEKKMTVDTVIFATGQQPYLEASFGVNLVKGNFVQVDSRLQTNVKGVFATGDVTYGTKSVVMAIESGRQVARSIDQYLGGDGVVDETLYERNTIPAKVGTIDGFATKLRSNPIEEGCGACEEASRCLQCDLRLQIQPVKYWVDSQFKKAKEGHHEV